MKNWLLDECVCFVPENIDFRQWSKLSSRVLRNQKKQS
jgi:hypothetical protein